MKLFGCITISCIYLFILIKLIVIPTDEFKFKLYEGSRTDTMICINNDLFENTISVKRFPLDTLALAPIKLIPHVDLNVTSSVQLIEGRPKPLSITQINNNSLGYCYLLSLSQASIVLPTTNLKSSDLAYDVSNYVTDVAFNLSNLDMTLMSDTARDNFLTSMSKTAINSLSKIDTTEADTIIELVKDDRTRYVYCYYVNETGSFIYDPEHPTNTHSIITPEGTYNCLTESWYINSVYKRGGQDNA